jgi:dihydroneopterin aldolase
MVFALVGWNVILAYCRVPERDPVLCPRVRRHSSRYGVIEFGVAMSQAEKITLLPSASHGRTHRIFVRDLVLSCRIGIYSHEKDGQQRVRLNLDLTCAEHPAINDDYANVVCYAELVADIRDLLGQGHINLVETLAERVAELCLRDRRVLTARIRVEKLDAVPDATSVGVEIERHRPVL